MPQVRNTGERIIRSGSSRQEDRMSKRVIPRKLFKIGEVMRYSGLSRQTVHNYTMLGLLTEAERTDSNHRLYGEEVFERIELIKKLRKSKKLKEIIQIFRDRDASMPA